MVNLITLSGITGLWVLVVATLSWLGQRLIVGGLEKRYQSQLTRAETELKSHLQTSEDRVKAELSSNQMVLQKALESSGKLDIDLRRKRESSYRTLWSLTAKASLHPPNKRLTYADVEHILVSMRDWYYEQYGGLYLSRESQSAYARAAQLLQDLCRGDGSQTVWDGVGGDYQKLHEVFSGLRTELTADLQTRVRNQEAAVREVKGSSVHNS